MISKRGSRRGQSITEYLLVMAAILGAVIFIRTQLKTSASTMMNSVANTFNNAAAAVGP